MRHFIFTNLPIARIPKLKLLRFTACHRKGEGGGEEVYPRFG